MLPEPPRALTSKSDAESEPEIPQRGVAAEERGAGHAMQICPNCSHQLAGYQCKLICTYCGYYLSCSDYY